MVKHKVTMVSLKHHRCVLCSPECLLDVRRVSAGWVLSLLRVRCVCAVTEATQLAVF